MMYSEPIMYRGKKRRDLSVNASYSDGTFIKYLQQNEFTKKILFRCWIKHKLIKNALRAVVYMFTSAPLTDMSKRTYLHVMSQNGDRASLDLTYAQHRQSTFLNIQNTLVNVMVKNEILSHFPTNYTYTPILHERTSVSILYLNDNKYEVFISPIGYFSFPKTLRVKSNKNLIYFPHYTLGEQDVLIFAIQIENRVSEFKREYFTAEASAQKMSIALCKEEDRIDKHAWHNLLCKLEAKTGSSSEEESVEEVEPVAELLVEPVAELLVEPVTLDIQFKCKPNPTITKLLYQSFHTRGAIYALMVGKKILVMSDIHNNYIPEQYKHFGIRLSDETTTSFTYHFYVNDTQILFYTSVMRVYD